MSLKINVIILAIISSIPTKRVILFKNAFCGNFRLHLRYVFCPLLIIYIPLTNRLTTINKNRNRKIIYENENKSSIAHTHFGMRFPIQLFSLKSQS